MWLTTTGKYAVIAVVSLVFAELAARVIDWSPRSRDQASGDSLGLSRYYHSPTGFGDLVPDQDGHWMIWFHRPYHVQTNSVGLRNVEEPAADAFRILALGDSQTFGPYLANEDTWPAWTENHLRQRLGQARPLQVFNAGIAGYTIADELAFLKDKGIAFAPRLVLLAVFENDLSDLRKERAGSLQRPRDATASRISTFVKVVARNSAFVSLAEEVKKKFAFSAAGIDIRRGEGDIARPPQPTDEPELRARYGELFRETVSLLRAHNVTLAVAFIPSLDALSGERASEVEPIVRALAQETQVPYLDLTEVMRSQPDPAATLFLVQRIDGSWVGNGHLSRAGNAAIGRAIAEWLTAEGLVVR
jgi:lysophospholipase L1-like esterase